MCSNCGCGKLDDNMGNPKNITHKTFEETAKASGKKTEKAKRNAYEAPKKEVEKKKVILPDLMPKDVYSFFSGFLRMAFVPLKPAAAPSLRGSVPP